MNWTLVVTDGAYAITFLLGVAAIIGWSMRHGWKLFGRARRVLDDFEGVSERKGVPARPGVMERLQRSEAADQAILGRLEAGDRRFDAIEARLDGFQTVLDATSARVHAELTPNGKPLAEKIDALYQALVVNRDGGHE